MKFVVLGRARQTAGPDEHLRVNEKFASWEPAGYTMETLLASPDGRVFAIVEADAVGPLAELVAQFSTAVDIEVIAVDDAQAIVPHTTSGYEWARS